MTSDFSEVISRCRGSLLGAMIGDIAGAPVEAESAGYIRRAYTNVDAILNTSSVPELFGGNWKVGYCTDDSQMMFALVEWLLDDQCLDGQALLYKFSEVFEPWRRYGPNTQRILHAFTKQPEKWKQIAKGYYSGGSYGNGSAMRVAPVGIRFHKDFKRLLQTARLSSETTHTHPLAIQGSTLQSMAVAVAMRTEKEQINPSRFFVFFRLCLEQTVVPFGTDNVFLSKLSLMEKSLKQGRSPIELREELGTDVEVHNSVPFAIYCALWNKNSFENAIHDAIFAGGDTDTIACMTGAISGALLGESSIPQRWIDKIQEEVYSPDYVRQIALRLAKKIQSD